MKRNLLSILTLLFALFTMQNISAQTKRTANVINGSNPYYAIYNLDETLDLCDNNIDVTLAYPCNKVEYQVKCNSLSINNKMRIDVSTNNGTSFSTIKTHGDISNSDYKSFSADINTNVNVVAFLKNGGTSIDMNLRQVKFTIAPHILLNSLMNNNLGEVMIGGTKSIDIDFKSFLTSGNLTVTTDNHNFLLNGKDTEITLCGGNTLEKLNENTKNFQVVYSAKTVGTESANITISDGTNTVTIIVTATCIKKTNTINWNNINTQIAIGESVSLKNVTSTNGNITFESSNPTIIKVENNQLVALEEGKATITAKVGETDEYQAAEATLEFEATQKTIQEIVWNQDFYLLKLGDADITLNAKATNKETGAENGNLIEYSVAEGGESVVTITNGILHIVGKGQTTITATQAGNEEYAAISRTMIVIVRESFNDCSSQYALADNNEYATGNASGGGFKWSTIEKEFTLSTIGDKLTFVAKASAGGAATGDGIKVTDQDGNVIYSKGAANISGANNLQLSRSVKSLKFRINANFRISLSNIFVTPASYLEPTTEKINFAGSEIEKTGVAEVVFNWANQPDMMWATIEDDTVGVFSVDQNSYIFGGSCGDYGISTVKVLFTAQKAGSYTGNLVVYRGEGENTTKMATIPITATAIKTPQVITWNQDLAALNPTIGNSYALEATATSGLPVYFTSYNDNIARIEGNNLIIVGAGTTTITARQDGNINYEAATIKEQTITINKLDQTITWNQEFASDLTIGNTIDLNASASSNLNVVFTSSNEAVATITNNILTVVGVGETTITATQTGNNNYNAANQIEKTLSIAKLNQTISWNQDLATLQIGESATLEASATSGLEIIYSSSDDAVASIEGSTITINGAGSVVITASQLGDNTYNPISTEKTFTFGRSAQTISWNDDLSTLKIGDVVTLTATSDANLDITYTIDNNAVASIEGNTLTIIGAGEATITASQNGNEAYNSASATKSINIALLSQTIEWNQDLSELTFENESLELTATATSGLEIVYSTSNNAVARIDGNILTIVGVGEATITARQVGNNQYEAVEMSQIVNITKLSQSIVWEQDLSNITLLDDYIELNAYSTSGLSISYTSSNENVAIINGNNLFIIGGGETVITAIQNGNDKYDSAMPVEKVVIITKQKQEIVWEQTFEDFDMYDVYELTAYATSGLEVTYELDETSIGKVLLIDNVLYPTGGNTYITIYAYQEGNDVYEAAQYVEKTIYINSKVQGPTTAIENNETTTLMYVNDIIYFSGEHNTLRVYDIAGRIVYSADIAGENQHYLPLTQRGIYVVCLDDEVVKIMK